MQHASNDKINFKVMFQKLNFKKDVGNLLAELMNIGDQFTNEIL